MTANFAQSLRFSVLPVTGLAALILLIGASTARAEAVVANRDFVSVEQSGKDTWKFNFKITVRNGQPALKSVTLVVAGGLLDRIVLPNSLSLGNLAAGATVTVLDSFQVRRVRFFGDSSKPDNNSGDWDESHRHREFVFEVIPGPGAVAQATISSAQGGTITVTGAGNPLDGARVVIPPGALGDPTDTITIAYSNALPSALSANATTAGVVTASKVVTLDRTGTAPLKKVVTVTIPYSVSATGPRDYPIVLYSDQNLGKYEPVQVIGVDQTHGLVTYSTKHFSSFLVVGLKGLALMLGGEVPFVAALVNLNTGFQPQNDAFEAKNFSSGIKGIANDGACFGLTSYAAWYFSAKKPSAGPLNAEYQTASDPGVTHIPQEDAIARELIAKTYADTISEDAPATTETDLQTAEEFLIHMLVTAEPQLAGAYSPGGAHSVMVYAWNGASLSFSVYDPNVPPTLPPPPPLQWSFGGAFVLPWTSADTDYTRIDFDAYGTHYDTTVLNALFGSIQSGGPPADAFGSGWNFNTLTISSPSITSSAYPGGPNGPNITLGLNGTMVTFTWDCPLCIASNYYLHVLQDDVPLLSPSGTLPTISNGGAATVTTLPFTEGSAELIAFVSTDSNVLTGTGLATQNDITHGYAGFQRGELMVATPPITYSGLPLQLDTQSAASATPGPVTVSVVPLNPVDLNFTGTLCLNAYVPSEGNQNNCLYDSTSHGYTTITSFTISSAGIGAATVDAATSVTGPDAIDIAVLQFVNGEVVSWNFEYGTHNADGSFTSLSTISRTNGSVTTFSGDLAEFCDPETTSGQITCPYGGVNHSPGAWTILPPAQ